jgi:hypothetical protein
MDTGSENNTWAWKSMREEKGVDQQGPRDIESEQNAI